MTERKKYNLKIIDWLRAEALKNPDLRFGQLLYMMNIIRCNPENRVEIIDVFHEESSDTYAKIKEKRI